MRRTSSVLVDDGKVVSRSPDELHGRLQVLAEGEVAFGLLVRALAFINWHSNFNKRAKEQMRLRSVQVIILFDISES